MAKIAFEEWALLETILRRVERRYVESAAKPHFVIDDARDGLETVAEQAHAELAGVPAQA